MPYRDLVKKKQTEKQLLAQAEAEADAAHKRIAELSSLRGAVKDPYRNISGLGDDKYVDSIEDDSRDNKGA